MIRKIQISFEISSEGYPSLHVCFQVESCVCITYPGIPSCHREDSHKGAVIGAEIIRGNVAEEIDTQNGIWHI